MQFAIKRGDAKQALKAQLLDSESLPVNLSGCEVRFKMAKKIDRIIDIATAIEGKVIVVFEPSDVDVVGRYDAEFEVKYADGRLETFPSYGYIKVVIQRDI